MAAPSITVTLRVVGLQFTEKVTITVDTPTIKDLMEAARGTARNFEYTTGPDGTLRLASAILLAPKASISSGMVYQPGLYSLADGEVGENSITTWQWYLIRRDKTDNPAKAGRQVNQPDEKTEAFSLPKDATSPKPAYRFLQDGDTVIWRLVVVAVKPIIKQNQTSFRNKVERLPNIVADAQYDPKPGANYAK